MITCRIDTPMILDHHHHHTRSPSLSSTMTSSCLSSGALPCHGSLSPSFTRPRTASSLQGVADATGKPDSHEHALDFMSGTRTHQALDFMSGTYQGFGYISTAVGEMILLAYIFPFWLSLTIPMKLLGLDTPVLVPTIHIITSKSIAFFHSAAWHSSD
jgi:hypothetical protein